MDINRIIADIDKEISKLQEAKALLSDVTIKRVQVVPNPQSLA